MTDVNLKMLKDTDGNAFVPFSTTDAVFKDGTNQTVSNLLDEKQATLVSGTNIKTINNESLLGAGNITVSAEDEIAISTTEPTGNEILWINPNEVPSGIGSYISNTYGTSQEIGYSQEYVNTELDKLKAYSLYNNTSGTTGNVTLSDSASNYEYIEIFYKNVDGIFSSTKVKSPNGKTVGLSCSVTFVGGSGNNGLYAIHSRIIDISGTSINTHSITSNGSYYGALALWENGSASLDKTNYIYITQVIGYK